MSYSPPGQTLLHPSLHAPGGIVGETVVPYAGYFTETADRPHLQQAVMTAVLTAGQAVSYQVELRGAIPDVGAAVIAAQGAVGDVCVSYTTLTVRSLTNPAGSWLKAQVSTTARVAPPGTDSTTGWPLEVIASAGSDLSISNDTIVSAAGDTVFAVLDLQVELWFG